MKKYIILTSLAMSFLISKTYAQVGMSSNNSNKNAILDLNRTDGTNTKGLVLPKVVLTGTNNTSPMSSHVAGMKVYNTATNGSGATAVTPGQYLNDGTQWIRIPNTAWELSGNSGTTPSTNFIGTSDAVDFITDTNNAERTRVTSGGQVLVGTTTIPTGGTTSKLIINNGSTAGAVQLKDGTEGAGKLFISDANGLGTWKSLSLGYRVMSSDMCSIINTPTDITVMTNTPLLTNYQFIPASNLTITVPSGYTNVKVVIRWDVWGSMAGAVFNQGSLRFAIKQTGTATAQTNSISMTSWANASGSISFNAPVAYTVSDLAPGTYTFQMGVSREDESAVPTLMRLWGIQGRAEVYVQ